MDRIQPEQKTRNLRVTKKRILIAVGIFFSLWIVFSAIFISACSSKKSILAPIADELSPELRAKTNLIPNYSRPEARTYLTFPEWYLVFNPQEYARVLSSSLPSNFPYLKSITQLWGSYCTATGIAHTGHETNFDGHLTNMVIVTSFTAEYATKSIWENTLGRFTEWSAGAERTPEDDYAAKIATEYGDFVPTKPFYEFPYGRAFVGLWSETPFWGKHIIRKAERKIALSLEYGVKALYGIPITWLTHAIFGIAPEELFAVATVSNLDVFKDPRVRNVDGVTTGPMIIAVPHYQGFTDVVPGLTEQGVVFLDVAGNNEIMFTAVGPSGVIQSLAGTVLFRMPMLFDTSRERVSINVRLDALGDELKNLKLLGGTVEHIYDY